MNLCQLSDEYETQFRNKKTKLYVLSKKLHPRKTQLTVSSHFSVAPNTGNGFKCQQRPKESEDTEGSLLNSCIFHDPITLNR